MNFRVINSFITKEVLQTKFPNTIFFLLLFFIANYSNSLSQSLTAEQIYKKVSGAVVVVHAYDENDKFSAQGSGVVINDKGYVVTNYHVLSGNERLEILHDKEIVPYVDIIGIDVEKDILILKIEAKKFPPIKIGDSNKLNIGQRVYAIGSPMGLENSISEGIISGLRSVDELKRNFIQITASISPGSSGGAVVNDKGELIGISTLTAKEGQNLNFAIPIEDVLKVEISSYSKNNAYKDFELFYKGYNAAINGDYQNAIKYFTKYLEIDPNYAEAFYNRGTAKVELTDYNGAIYDFNKALEINPRYADAFFNRGTTKIRLTDYTGAIQDYTKAIEINHNFAMAYFSRGFAKYILSEYIGATQDYSMAIEINPQYAVAYSNRGIVKAELSDYRGAIQDYNKAIEINPILAEAYHNRGIAKAGLSDYSGAIQDFTKAIDINPKYVDAYYNRGVVIDKLLDYRGAIKDYSKAIEINPKYANAYSNRGNAKANLRDYKGAIQDYNKAIEINPKYADAYYNCGISKYKLSNYKGAVQYFTKAIEINPKYANAYSNRGNAKYNLGDKNGACLDWRKAGELGESTVYDLIKKYCN